VGVLLLNAYFDPAIFLQYLLTIKFIIMDPILGMIILWSCPRVPQGWFPCDGRQLPISQYQALFAIIGTTFGGDGQTYFNIPDLRSRIPIGIGQGTSLSNYMLGQKGGTEAVALTLAQMAAHNHAAVSTNSLTASVSLAANGTLPASSSYGTSVIPGPNFVPAKAPDYQSQGLSANNIYGAFDGTKMPVNITFPQNPAPVTISGGVNVTLQNTGANEAHTNIQPCLGLQYLMAFEGIFPSFD
jgi:microcystin-dependent protein